MNFFHRNPNFEFPSFTFSGQNHALNWSRFLSLLRLKEPALLLGCRKEDLDAVNSCLESAKEEYAEKAGVHQPEVIVNDIYLPPAPSHQDEHALSCSGGVVLASRDGKIVFENSLNTRLDVVFRHKLPPNPFEKADLTQ